MSSPYGPNGPNGGDEPQWGEQQQPYGQPGQQPPYGQPGQQSPYGRPGQQQPYGGYYGQQPGQTGQPYGGQAGQPYGGQAGQPHGQYAPYGQPGQQYGQQWQYPRPDAGYPPAAAPKKKRSALPLVLLAVGVLVLAGVAILLLAASGALGKTTFVTQLGIDGAKQRVRDLLARADSALAIFGTKGDVLRAAARFVAERKN